MLLTMGVNISQVLVSLNIKIKEVLSVLNIKSNITQKNITKQIIPKKTLHAIHKMWFIYFLVINAMYSMFVKLVCHFIKETIYTEALILDTSMLRNISKIFALVHLSQFKSLRYFLVLDRRKTRCVQLTVKPG